VQIYAFSLDKRSHEIHTELTSFWHPRQVIYGIEIKLVVSNERPMHSIYLKLSMQMEYYCGRSFGD
jgi:hypothetical protein